MMAKYNHRERMEVCLSGEKPDRAPVALWRHFPVDDQNPYDLAAATVNFQRVYDFDFVKVSPASSFCIKEWGVEDEWRGSSEGDRAYTKPAITGPEDWLKLRPQDVTKGWLGGQLDALRMITSELGADVPVIQTVFNPLSQAKNLTGRGNLVTHLRKYPDAVHAGLQVIVETTHNFIQEARKTGIAGIFYAVQHAQYELLTEAEYLTFGSVYDLQVLEPASSLWLNVLHLHGVSVMFHLFQDYPCHVINWHDLETYPSLAEGQRLFRGCVCGGLSQWKSMELGTPQDVEREVREAVQATGGKRFVLGTGCVTPVIAPHGNLLAARRGVEKYS